MLKLFFNFTRSNNYIIYIYIYNNYIHINILYITYNFACKSDYIKIYIMIHIIYLIEI